MKKIIILIALVSSYVQAQTSYLDFTNTAIPASNNSNPIQAPEAVLGGLTTYADLATFQTATAAGVLTSENFSNTLTPGAITNCGEIIDSTLASACFALGGLQPGFTIIANDDSGDMVQDLVFIGLPALGVTTDLVGANSFTDSTELQFSAPDVTAVAFDTSVAFAAADVTITAFDSTDTSIGSFVLSIAAIPGLEFAGFTSPVPISRVTMAAAAGEGELIGNLIFGSLAPPPPPAPIPSLSNFSLILLTLFVLGIATVLFRRNA